MTHYVSEPHRALETAEIVDSSGIKRKVIVAEAKFKPETVEAVARRLRGESPCDDCGAFSIEENLVHVGYVALFKGEDGIIEARKKMICNGCY